MTDGDARSEAIAPITMTTSTAYGTTQSTSGQNKSNEPRVTQIPLTKRPSVNDQDADEELGCCGCTGCRQSCFIYLILGIFGTFFLVLTIISHWFALLGLLSILPAMLFLYVLYWRKHRDSVRVGRAIKFYLYGILGAAPSVLIETVLHKLFSDPIREGEDVFVRGILFAFFESFIIAALTEEVLKYLLISLCPGHSGVQRAFGVIVLTTSGALGFATLENVSYVLTSSPHPHEQFVTAIFRAFLAVPLHGTTGMMIGAKMARNVFFNESIPFYSILFIPFLLHGMYDFLLIAPATVDNATFASIGFATVCLLVVLGGLYAHSLARGVLKQAAQAEAQPIITPPRQPSIVVASV